MFSQNKDYRIWKKCIPPLFRSLKDLRNELQRAFLPVPNTLYDSLDSFCYGTYFPSSFSLPTCMHACRPIATCQEEQKRTSQTSCEKYSKPSGRAYFVKRFEYRMLLFVFLSKKCENKFQWRMNFCLCLFTPFSAFVWHWLIPKMKLLLLWKKSCCPSLSFILMSLFLAK